MQSHPLRRTHVSEHAKIWRPFQIQLFICCYGNWILGFFPALVYTRQKKSLLQTWNTHYLFLAPMQGTKGTYRQMSTKARQTRFIVSHQPPSRFTCKRAVTIHYLLLANAIYVRQIYGSTTIKNGHVNAWKAIMTVEVAGLRGSGC